MADVYSQADIDSLLKGAARAGTDAGPIEIIPYNFLRPPRIAKDRQALLNGIYQRIAVALQSLFSSRLRTPVDVTLASVEQATFAEFIFSLATPCAAYVYTLGDRIVGQGVLDLGTDFSLYLIDRLFGGPGEPDEVKRPLTVLERGVVRGMADKAWGLVQEAWADHLTFQPEYAGFESSPDALQVANREDNVLVSNIEVRSGAFTSLITICIPLLSLESFLQEKPTRHLHNVSTTPAERDAARRSIERTLRASRLEVRARFPVFQLRAADLGHLEVGQVIHTGHPSDVPVELLVRGQRRFLGTLGQSRQYVGLRISHALAPDRAEGAPKTSRGRLV
ncbi:MAG TPA: FliM/FliN family flagellar motor switch protein [Gemmatimonadales bacterium]|nr:FliM/FliN family flagellar motor switch protein [Gemmatimonadales bacterium]